MDWKRGSQKEASAPASFIEFDHSLVGFAKDDHLRPLPNPRSCAASDDVAAARPSMLMRRLPTWYGALGGLDVITFLLSIESSNSAE